MICPTDEDVAGFKPPTLLSLDSSLYLLSGSQPNVTYNQSEFIISIISIISMKIDQFIDITPYNFKKHGNR